MGQDKKQLTKLLTFVKELCDDPDNKEFAAGIQSIIEGSSKASTYDKDKIEEIYELCLEKNAKEQAVGLYGGFPFPEITDSLVEDYVIMERFRRKGDFNNFGAHLFLQIESICNAICADGQYQEIYTRLLNAELSAFVNNNGDIANRYSDSKHTTVNRILFGDYQKTEKGENKKDIRPSKLGMFDKIKCALYMAGFASMLRYSSYGEWIYNTNLIYDIYVIRCQADHRGGELTENQERRLDTILPQKSRYYALFFSELIYFVNKIAEGSAQKNKLIKYANRFRERTEECTVTNVLPSTLFVKNDSEDVYDIPSSISGKTSNYKVGQEIKVSFNRKGQIVKVEVENQSPKS